MTNSNWERIQDLYHEAMALPRSQRGAFVAKACAGDPNLERELNLLLEANDSSSDFLDTPVVKLGSVPDNLVGLTIAGRYLVESELGHGGMSQVYLARDANLQGQPVVVKVLSQALVQNLYARQRFQKEIAALLRMDHPGVVRVLDANTLADGKPYIVMQYVDGEMLRSQIPTEGMNLKRAASILRQVGAALDHVHEQGVFHRDLKPENIMLKRGTDSAVLIDFGIAKVIDSAVATSTVNGGAGTLVYMSPEQLRGQEIAAASDIYSLAVIAYEMVTGRRPFKPTSPAHLLDLQRARVRAKPCQLRDNLSPEAEKIILRALSFDPRRRYRSAKEFGDSLADALLESPVPPPSPPGVKVVVASLIILAVVGLLSFGIYKYLRQAAPPAPSHAFNYWLMVQRMRDGKEYQPPYKSNGEETFQSGDAFQLNVSGVDAGYLYVVNEGPPEPNDTNFRMIYPNAGTNSGAATLGANQTVQSDWITFRGPAGNENFWIVWSVSPVIQFETAKAEAFKHPRGGLTGESLVVIRQFLTTTKLQTEVKVIHYNANQTAVAKGKSDVVITLAQFKHR